jgi:hypothetical protein
MIESPKLLQNHVQVHAFKNERITVMIGLFQINKFGGAQKF